MTDRPIIFSAPMVRALLAGRKTQTRRLLNPQPELFPIDEAGTPCMVSAMQVDGDDHHRIALGSEKAGVLTAQRVNFGIGDRLWVKERYTVQQCNRWTSMAGRHLDTCIDYAADDQRDWIRFMEAEAPKIMKQVKERKDGERAMAPAIFLPKPASRLTLIVEGVKVERLQDISEADAVAEGMSEPSLRDLGGDLAQAAWSERQVFSRLWQHLHNPESWDANPFVVALTFRVVPGNIDRLPAERLAA